MGRKSISILAVGAIAGALAGGAMADLPGGGRRSGEIRVSSIAQEFVPEGNWAGTDWQTSSPVEAVAMPEEVSEESWMKSYGND